MNRDEEILKAYKDLGGNKAEVGRKFNMTRERVGQIIKKITGKRSPMINDAKEVNWTLFRLLKRTAKISSIDVGNMAKCSAQTVNQIMAGNMNYINNSKSKAYTTSTKVAIAILRILNERLNRSEKLLIKIGKQLDSI